MRRPITVALLAIALPSRPLAHSQPTVAAGQEWYYTGTLTQEYALILPDGKARNERVTLQVSDSATVVAARSGRCRAVRDLETTPPPGIAFGRRREVWIAKPEAENDTPLEWVLGQAAADPISLPLPFGSPPPSQDRSDVSAQPLPLRTHVAGVASRGNRTLLRIERTVAAPLPLSISTSKHPDTHLLGWNEQFWVDRQSGALFEYLRAARLRAGSGARRTTWRYTVALELKGVRPLTLAATRAREEEARTLARLAAVIRQRSDASKRKIRLQQAQEELRKFRREHPHSAYAEGARCLEAEVQREQTFMAKMELLGARSRRQADLVGASSPRLSLADLSGKRRALAGFRGKVLLLAFFASW